MTSKQIFGYVILNKVTHERFPTNKGCYNSKSAATQGFNRITVKGYYSDEKYNHLKGVAFKDQDEYGVYPLVAHIE